MAGSTHDLPSFEKPPVVEVVLGVQFDPIEGLGVPQLGLLWQHFRDKFPITEDHPPLPRVSEEFGKRQMPQVRIEAELITGPMVPRVWFLNRDGSELVQVQPDRLLVNWRKTEASREYPHYHNVRQKFDAALDAFREFLAEQNLGDVHADQCEVTYINHLVSGEGWTRHGEVSEVAAVWSGAHSDEFLPEPEEARFLVRYVIRSTDDEIRGRLHLALEPAQRIRDSQPILVLNITARGQAIGEGIAGIGRFLDLGHEWVVRGFASATTPTMHAVWRRRDGD